MLSVEKMVLHLNEKLLKDDRRKDVEIEMSDGNVMAHSLILMAGSEAVDGILTNGTAATADLKRLTWKEHDKAVGQFFLRLL